MFLYRLNEKFPQNLVIPAEKEQLPTIVTFGDNGTAVEGVPKLLTFDSEGSSSAGNMATTMTDVWPCPLCDKSLVHLNNMARHFRQVHLMQMDEAYELYKRTIWSSHPIPKCSVNYGREYAVIPEPEVIVQECQGQGQDEDPLSFDDEPQEIPVTVRNVEAVPLALSTCHICEQSFTDTFALALHSAVHQEEKLIQCDVCEQEFLTPTEVKTHRRKCHPELFKRLPMGIHNSQREHVCPICNKSFKFKYNMNRHVAGHSGQRNHVCDCGKKFVHAQNLHEHIRAKHTGEKPFVCSHCGERFARCGTLISHERRHPGVRPPVRRINNQSQNQEPIVVQLD